METFTACICEESKEERVGHGAKKKEGMTMGNDEGQY
jgi:hypothetical protein